MNMIEVKISDRNSKLGKIPNISTIPIKDCGNCESCRSDCYALKAWKQYPAVRKAWGVNSKAFRADPVAACEFVFDQLNTVNKPRFFRIHVAGDFLNQKHVDAWISVCERLPEIKFLAFTKMHSLDYSNIPDNLQIVFSMFPTCNMPEKQENIRFAWVTNDKAGNVENRIPEGAIECPGKCDTCGMCWNLSNLNNDVFFHNH